jgi:hypothetical protein
MTTGEGWNNINNATKSSTATSKAPVCNVEIEDFQFGSYSEKSDWSGPMVSTWTGSIYAEESCNNLLATVQLMDCETASSIVTTPITLVAPAEGSLIWTFSASVEAPNNFGYFCGSLSAFDGTNEADLEEQDTE